MLFSPAPRNTLAYWLKGRALGAHLDRRYHTVVSSAKACNATGWMGSTPNPIKEAVQFYLLNHATAEISAKFEAMEPLPEPELKLVSHYVETGSAIAMRLYFYILLITAREARHNKSGSMSAKVQSKFLEDYPLLNEGQAGVIYSFLKGFPDSSGSALSTLHAINPTIQLGPFVKMMQLVYYNCSWSSSYGGPKWGNIADCLYRFVTGEWTAEMLADTAYTLAHNCAPIFNKGMLYSTPNTAELVRVLDVQRAGMIPQFVASEGSNYLDAKDAKIVNAALPGFISGTVDWQKVQDLGAVGHYVQKTPKPQPTMTMTTGIGQHMIKIDAINQAVKMTERAE